MLSFNETIRVTTTKYKKVTQQLRSSIFDQQVTWRKLLFIKGLFYYQSMTSVWPACPFDLKGST